MTGVFVGRPSAYSIPDSVSYFTSLSETRVTHVRIFSTLQWYGNIIVLDDLNQLQSMWSYYTILMWAQKEQTRQPEVLEVSWVDGCGWLTSECMSTSSIIQWTISSAVFFSDELLLYDNGTSRPSTEDRHCDCEFIAFGSRLQAGLVEHRHTYTIRYS